MSTTEAASPNDGNNESRSSKTTTTFWYFAIGSMMHPISMKHRNIVPLESVAGEIYDYKISFFSKMGFAVADPCDDEEEASRRTYHGVLHRVDEPTMKRLDVIEINYKRRPAKARRYDTNEVVECQVYTSEDPTRERGPHVDNPPYERYIGIMIAGAEHYKLDPEYISWLKNQPCQPRPKPEEFFALPPVPVDAPTISLEELKEMDGLDGRPLCATVNGKVIKCTISDPESKRYKGNVYTIQSRGQVLDFFFAKVAYDLKYGAPERLEDFTRQHGAYLEDTCIRAMKSIPDFLGKQKDWEVIGSLERVWKD